MSLLTGWKIFEKLNLKSLTKEHAKQNPLRKI